VSAPAFRAAIVGIVLVAMPACLPGCLPKGALGRRDDVEADTYALALDVEVHTDGPVTIAPFHWMLAGTIAESYTRTFRDGSLGHLVRFEGMTGTVERPGAAPVPVPVALDGAFVELRAFPDGEVLKVSGVSRWVGEKGHVEALDLLWPVMCPHLPGSAREAADTFGTGWPAWASSAGLAVRSHLASRWSYAKEAGASHWRYTGDLLGTGGYVRGAGHAEGDVILGTGAARLAAHHFDWTRTVDTDWSTGAHVTQTWHATGRVEHRGTAAAPLLDASLAGDDLGADALPVRLRDGRVVEDPPVDLGATLPFLLLPDDLPEVDRAQVRATLVGAGRVDAEDARP
jgi:hypothetical protein